MKRLIAAALLFTSAAQAQIKLPAIIRDSMILQRNTPIGIWGWAAPAEKVTIRFNSKTYHTTTGTDGKWTLQLAPQKAGGPYSMQINKITLKDILIGDVWFCSGQSNMEHQLKLHDILYADEIKNANNPNIRQFKVPNTTSLSGPKADLPGGAWRDANPDNVKDFSAVAYFFAKALYEKYHVPIGIINSSWGGIPIEAMMSPESLSAFPGITPNPKVTDAPHGPTPVEDLGMTEKWYDPGYSPKGWHTIAIPGFWEDQGARNLHGIVWYRREIDVPASMTGKPAKIFLGRIVDADEVYIDGQKIGNTTYLYPQRRYAIPEGLLEPGRNLIVIRVSNYSGKGGFVPDKPYQLIAGNDTLNLTGYYQYKAGFISTPGQDFRAPAGTATQNQPTALYNTMIAPLTNYTIKGFVWYQGESNTGKPTAYGKLLPAMIADWRNRWKEGNIPFLFVQLPGFMDYNYAPSESNWALFREAQTQTLSVPNTAMAVAIDLGEWNDVHPDHKKEVGNRLALAAEKIAYGENILAAGPLFQSASIDSDRIVISFNNTGSGLTTSDGEAPHEFAIAGEDKKFVWAKARIEGNKIILSSDAVKAPQYIRYAWADDPVNPNLYNKEGLPAAPFRTDK